MTIHRLQLRAELDPQLIQGFKRLNKLIRLPEIRQLFLDRFHSRSELVRIDRNDALTPGTRELRIVFKPSQAFLDFMAANAMKQP